MRMQLDRAAMHADRRYAQQFSVTSEDELELIKREQQQLSLVERTKEYIIDHRFSVLGYGWLTTVGLSLAWNFSRKDVSFPQKLINSRMIAQTATLLGLASIATMMGGTQPAQKIDPHYERVMAEGAKKEATLTK